MLPTVTVSPLNFQIGHNLFTEKGECGGGDSKGHTISQYILSWILKTISWHMHVY